ncbi:MAG: 30S ribosomal protein S2 [Clostridia bacterium]|nr:30S ribosomal protein S2 [Clostridia bacterium]MDD4386248.1 30S ribosomal protein S2 [Clostridia bacterium]
MSIIPMKSLLEAGVHFGHQTKRWDPRMAPYIFTARNGIYILDLQKTLKKTQEAYNLTKKIVSEGGNVLFVGTKKQIQDTIKNEAERCGMFYINSRWLGGTLTNLNTIKKRIARLIELEKMEAEGTFEVLPKKEVIGLKKQMEKLNLNLGGIKTMEKLPSLIFLVDSKKEYICTKEARKLNIPTIGLIDSNCNPEDVDYVVPGNDDSVRSVALIVAKIADAVLEVKEGNTELSQDEYVDTMEALVAEVGVDKIERKPRQNNRFNNNRNYNNNYVRREQTEEKV